MICSVTYNKAINLLFRENTRISDSETEQEISDGDEVEGIYDEPYFVGKDKTTTWKKHVPPTNVKTRAENILTHLPGAKSTTKNIKSPVEIWKYFFNDDMVNIIVECTNKHIKNIQNKYSRDRDAKETDLSEVLALIGLLYLAGVRQTKCG